MISLIANSGIQLLVRDVEFDLNSGYKKLFYESFDTANLQWRLEYGRKLKGSETVVLNSELREKGYVDNEGNLIASDNVILANPHATKLDIAQGLPTGLFYSKLSENNRNLDSFFNVWLPLPYLEVDSEGSFKDGPYNWSRCKIIPGEKENGKLKAQLVLVFDTRTIYDDYDEYREGPSFINEGDTEKHYALCRDELKLIDYCVWNNSWVRDTIMKLVYPDVTDFNALLLPDGSNKYSFLTTYLTLVDYLGNNADVPDVRFMRDRNVKHVPVEMIVDIGNSRTSAILFEEQDFTKVDTLKLQD
ncbi:MAG: virulence factor SrfB, partial [Muribaculaceae bacterium]|nr:virulence factor SrfB [Muribaculaceae bacterium]